MDLITPEIRKKAYQTCHDFIGGIWKTITPDDIIIQHLSGGYTNLSLKLSLSEGFKAIAGEPVEVVMRNTLGLIDSNNYARMTENIIVILLAENNLAPKVYGVFDGGRLDEYIVSRTLVTTDLDNLGILEAIGRKLAHLHAINIPITKNPAGFYKRIEELQECVLSNISENEADLKRKELLTRIKSLNPCKEINWLLKNKDTVNSPVVYCHGDLQINNILLCENSPNHELYIIDHDISGYNYRGHDFANLFNSFCFHVPYSEPPYFQCNWNHFPSVEKQRFLIRIYLEEYQKKTNRTINIEEEENHILEEFKIFLLIFYYFAFLYSYQRAGMRDSNVKMDWVILGNVLIDLFIQQKKAWFTGEK